MITGLNATEGVRRTYLAMLVVYLAFVIYGSVVPLEFRRVPVSGIWSEFSWGSPPTEQRISRSDFATNVLLFVPVTFLAMGVVTRRNARWVSRTVTVAVVCSAWGLSLIVESAQVFIPPRVASVSDIVAQWIGAGLGLLAWYAMGDRVTRWARGLWTDPAQHRLAVKILWVYALGFVFHQLLPLDLSLRPCDLYSKLTADRVNFCPFADVRYSSLYTIVMKTTMMMPVGLLLTLLTSRRRAVVWVVAVQGLGFAAAVEMLQVFTFSRYASSTDVVFGTLGAAIGAYLTERLRSTSQGDSRSASGRMVAASVAVAWTVMLVWDKWRPFEFSWPAEGLTTHIAVSVRSPMLQLSRNSSVLLAIGQVFREFAGWAALGMLLGAAMSRPYRNARLASAITTACVIAIGLELGQLFIPQRTADVATAGVCVAGAVVGVMLYRQLTRMFDTRTS